MAASAAGGTALKGLEVETTTMVNSKTQPRLLLGRNTVYVGTGAQADSMVFWPEMQGDRYKQHVVEERNIGCLKEHMGYQGVIFPQRRTRTRTLCTG
jgi:hypothetical protein